MSVPIVKSTQAKVRVRNIEREGNGSQGRRFTEADHPGMVRQGSTLASRRRSVHQVRTSGLDRLSTSTTRTACWSRSPTSRLQSMTLDIVLAAILSLQPHLKTNAAERYSRAILETTHDASDAAALIVTAHRESSFSLVCVEGIGGRGGFGLGKGYSHWACSTLKIQSVMAMQAFYDKGWPYNERGAFKRYLGATRNDWPEIDVRMRLWQLTRARLDCGCSL